MPPDRKRQPRIVDPDAGRAKLVREGKCRLCRKPYPPWQLTRHHLVPRNGSHAGDDVDDNLVPLCGSGTVGCHGLVERSQESRSRLRRFLLQAELAYMAWRMGDDGANPDKGKAWIDRRYPRHVPMKPRRGEIVRRRVS
jgi:hypothetical protein